MMMMMRTSKGWVLTLGADSETNLLLEFKLVLIIITR